jgi:hypothetical protein
METWISAVCIELNLPAPANGLFRLNRATRVGGADVGRP